jgi:hypothetical protein
VREITPEAEEGLVLKEDAVEVLQILVVEVKIKITVNQVVIDLINQILVSLL